MDTKRNLRYFTAPLISPYTVIGLVVAIAGFVVCRLFMSEIQWVAFIGLVVMVIGICIIVYGEMCIRDRPCGGKNRRRT